MKPTSIFIGALATLISPQLLAVNCASLANWNSTQAYNGGDQVQHTNTAFKAKWWTQNQDPNSHSAEWDVWENLGICDGTTPINLAPVANLNGPYSGTVNQSIGFSSAGSNDSDGSITSYSWNFGDGNTSTLSNPTHTYSAAGTYTVTLTVTDNDGASDTDSGVATISDSGTGGPGGDCAGVPAYVAGTTYGMGEHVSNFVDSRNETVEFVCNVGGWCSSSSAWAYEPGNGQHWQDAWGEIGVCGASGGNQSPVANANGPYSAEINQTIQFSSSGSSDADGMISSYLWSFGDGQSSTVANPSHAYANSGNYSVTLTVTDDQGASTTDSALTSISGPGGSTGHLPKRALVGYWHNFINGAGYLPIAQVSADWDIVNISFAENAHHGQAGEVAFAPAEESETDFLNGVRMLQQRGQKVLISLGGANAHIALNNVTERDNFVRTMGDIIQRYGFDGMDIDLEGGSLNMTHGDSISTPTTPAIVNLIDATRSIKARFGSNFILTMAPETAYVQGGYANFGGIWGAYLPLIHALRNDLNMLHVQHYNTGSIRAANDIEYQPGTTDFHVALSDMMITGFNAGGDPNNHFPGLRADQMGFGLPASAGAASSGQTDVATTQRALDCLIQKLNCESYIPAQAHDNFRGLMTWSINWDEFINFGFSGPHRSYLNSKP